MTQAQNPGPPSRRDIFRQDPRRESLLEVSPGTEEGQKTSWLLSTLSPQAHASISYWPQEPEVS